MKGTRFVWAAICLVLMLNAGTVFGQSIFQNSPKDLSISIAVADTAAPSAPGSPAGEQKGKFKHEKKEIKQNPNWGGFGGTGVEYLPLNFDNLKPLTKDRGMDNFDPLWTIGGFGGAIYKNFRFGGYGFGASQRTERHKLQATIDFGGGGLFGEYDKSFSKKVGLFIGSQVGAGGVALSAKGADLGPSEKWDGHTAVFLAYPYVGVWFAPLDWMWVRIDGGYQYFQADLTNSDFRNELGDKMTDGNLMGNYQIGLNLCFGYQPKGK